MNATIHFANTLSKHDDDPKSQLIWPVLSQVLESEANSTEVTQILDLDHALYLLANIQSSTNVPNKEEFILLLLKKLKIDMKFYSDEELKETIENF